MKIYVSKKCCEENHNVIVDLLLLREGEKKHYVLIKDFKTFMYDHYIVEEDCRYCFHAFITEETLKRPIKDCFKIKGKQRIIMPKKVNMLNSKTLKER